MKGEVSKTEDGVELNSWWLIIEIKGVFELVSEQWMRDVCIY